MSDFLLAGIATSAACIFSHPFETCKVRLQLQNQLQSSSSETRHSSRSLILKSIRDEGILSLQRGLPAGMCYQFVMNGCRLGVYSTLQRGLNQHERSNGIKFFLVNLTLGAGSGAAGAFLASPFFMVKTRMQNTMLSLDAKQLKNVGHQYRYSGVIDALKTIYKTEGGLKALWRGSSAACLRVASGSAAQLSSYDSTKRLCVSKLGMDPTLTRTHFLASAITSGIVTLCMNPLDVVSTRLYNQQISHGKGAMYNSVGDCIVKMYKSEGIMGFYKGGVAHYARLAPHTILTFVFWEFLKNKFKN